MTMTMTPTDSAVADMLAALTGTPAPEWVLEHRFQELGWQVIRRRLALEDDGVDEAKIAAHLDTYRASLLASLGLEAASLESDGLAEHAPALDSLGGHNGTWWLEGHPIKEPYPWWPRPDSVGILGARVTTMLYGKPGDGKTLIAVHMALWAVQQGGVGIVFGLDEPDSETQSKGRALAAGLGVDGSSLDRLIYMDGSDNLPGDGDGRARSEVLADWDRHLAVLRGEVGPDAPFVVVLDYAAKITGRAMGSSNTADDVEAALEPWKALFRRHDAALVLLAHESTADGGGGRPLGSTTWRGVVDVLLHVRTVREFAPGVAGRLQLRCKPSGQPEGKDRHGRLAIYRHPSSHVVMDVRVEPGTVEGATVVRATTPVGAMTYDPDADGGRGCQALPSIRDVLDECDGVTISDVTSQVHGLDPGGGDRDVWERAYREVGRQLDAMAERGEVGKAKGSRPDRGGRRPNIYSLSARR